jgi:cell division transport system permease protein
MSALSFKTATGYVKRSPFQALSAIFVLSLTFFVGTAVALLVYSSSQVLKYFETRPQVIAFLKGDATPEAISTLQNKLATDTRIKEVKYVSKEEALSIYKNATSDNPLLSELVSPSIFPASLEFSVNNLGFASTVISEVKSDPIVAEVGYTASLGGEKSLQDVVTRLKTATFYLRLGGGIFAGILALTSFLILMVIIGMRVNARRGEIEILELIGATKTFIRSPIVLEAFMYSLIGVLVGWMLAFIFFLYLTPTLVSYFGEIPVLPRETLSVVILFASVLGIEILVGCILAWAGSMVALSRARQIK